ncbi:MAG TPA: hypothetical protein VFP61_07085, partial [Acidimicrobiales bacterium]|nr:hypothetical protein [Acidimicrobiales bacterium]
SVVPGDDGARRGAALRRTLLLAAGSATADAARAAAATAVARQVRVDEAGIGLPGPTSVTLTARKGTIPLTILSNPGLDAHLLLQVRSAKLAFLPFDAGGGPCRLDRTGESCPLVLSAVATTIRLPVETRTSGVFPLDVELRSPDGRTTLAGPVHDTVRSTAFSNVGVVLIVLALLGLAGWWARDLRHGRRAHQLVEPRTGELPAVPPAHPAGRQPGRPAGRPPDRAPGDSRSSGDDPGDVGRPSAGEASWLGDDPEVARFFATPPPAWQPASPFGPSQGPNP